MFKKLGTDIHNYLKGLNTQTVAKVGNTLFGIGAVITGTQVQTALPSLVHNNQTRLEIASVGGVLMALGQFLATFGRPVTVPDSPPPVSK
jgi:hypothetical protein